MTLEASTSSPGPVLPCSQEQFHLEAQGVMCTHTHAWGTTMQRARSCVVTRAPCEVQVCTKPSVPPTPSHTEATLGRTECARSTCTSWASQLPAGGRPEHVAPDLHQSLRNSSLPRGRACRENGGDPRWSHPLCLPRGWVTLGKPPPTLRADPPHARSEIWGAVSHFWLSTRARSPPWPLWHLQDSASSPRMAVKWLGLQAEEVAASGPWFQPRQQRATLLSGSEPPCAQW